MTLDSSFAKQLCSSSERLFSFLENFHRVKVLVVGDLTLDEFLTGQVERVSREAPVLIIRHEQTRQLPGGGANAVYNLAKLGAHVKVVGLLGKDDQGQALQRIFAAAKIDTSGIFFDLHRPTVTKTRISGHARQSVTQQIVRVDRKSDDLPEKILQLQLADYIRSQVAEVDVVVCSDYGDGVFTPPVIAAALTHPLTIVDTQQYLPRFAGATLFTPNLPEAEKAVGYPISSPEILAQAGKDLLTLTQAQQILITRGESGMSLFDSRSDSFENRNSLVASHIPAFNRSDVYDVTGAGDTVVAALTLGLCAGASAWEAAVLGNLAASIVIRKFGTSTTTPGEIKLALETLLDELKRPL